MRSMLRLRFLAIMCAGLLLLTAVVLAGCAKDVVTEVPAGEEVTSSCVGCHTNADALYLTTSEETEVEEPESEGEG